MTNEAAVRTGSPKRCIHANIKHYFKQNKMSYSRFEEIQETPPHILAIRFCGRVQFPAHVLDWARRKQEKANDQMEAEKRKQLRIERKAQLAELMASRMDAKEQKRSQSDTHWWHGVRIHDIAAQPWR